MARARHAPLWVQDLDIRQVHAIAFKLNAERTTAELSDAQEWLFDLLVDDLDYRRRNTTWPERRCSCSLCWNPFEEP